MSGIRIQHDTYRSTMLTLVDGKRPYPKPYGCATCGRVHEFKTYHLRLDDVGATIVSHEIVARLKALPANGGFAIREEIATPPPQRIDLSSLSRSAGPAVTVHPALVEPR